MDTYVISLGEPRTAHRLFTCLTTSSVTLSGLISGTILIENLPVTFEGITVFCPVSWNAPSIPVEVNNIL